MPEDAPLLFAIAGLNASLSGLAGLVAGLRRGPDFAPLYLYRLRQIVEFAFFNALLAVSMIPLTGLLGQDGAIRVAGSIAFVGLWIDALILFRRMRRMGVNVGTVPLRIVILLDLVVVALAPAVVVSANPSVFELLLITMLARPMLAFLLVLASLEAAQD
jgi:hypothetical protein